MLNISSVTSRAVTIFFTWRAHVPGVQKDPGPWHPHALPFMLIHISDTINDGMYETMIMDP
jgi:hypothetical protein